MNGTSVPETGNITIPQHDDLTVFDYMFYTSMGTLGAFFNFIVLYIAFKYVDMEDKPRQIIVVNMTIADFIFCVLYVVTRPYITHFPIWTCRPYYIATWSVQMCSIINLLWLNLDKLIYIQFPLHYYHIVSRKKLLLLSTVTWAVVIVISTFCSVYMSIGDSLEKVTLATNIVIPQLSFYVIAIMASFIISAIIYIIAHTTTRVEGVAKAQMLRRLLFVFSSTLCTFGTCLPYRLLYLIFRISPDRITDFFKYLTSGFFFLLVMGIVINPVITIATQWIYRVRVFAFFRGVRTTKTDQYEETAMSVAQRRQSEIAPLTNRS